MNRIITCLVLALAILYEASATTQVHDSTLVIKPKRNIESLITIDTISCVDFSANTITFNDAIGHLCSNLYTISRGQNSLSRMLFP